MINLVIARLVADVTSRSFNVVHKQSNDRELEDLIHGKEGTSLSKVTVKYSTKEKVIAFFKHDRFILSLSSRQACPIEVTGRKVI